MAWIIAVPGVPVDDAHWYWTAARTLYSEHAYLDAGRPTAYWPVGYPFFLACFSPLGNWALHAAQTAQALLSAATVPLIHAISLRAGATRRNAGWAAAAFAFYPSSISLASLSLSETVFTFTLCMAFWAAFRFPGARGLVWASLALASSCYIRPVALLLAPLLYGPMLFASVRDGHDGKTAFRLSRGPIVTYLLRTLAVTLILLATALPWAARNYRAFGGVAAYATNFGINLYIGHNDAAEGGYVYTPAVDSIERAYPNELERSHHFQAMALEFASSHPAREARLFVVKLFRLLVSDRTNIYASFVTEQGGTYPSWTRVLGLLNNLYYLACLAPFLIIPWWKSFRSHPYLPWLIAAFWIQILFYCAFFTADRYRFPTMPFLLAAVACRPPDIASLKRNPSLAG